MTGGIIFAPEAERQLNELDDWITKQASAGITQRFVSAILDRIETILAFPHAGRASDDVRAGMRSSTVKNRTLVSHDVDEFSGELVVNMLGVFHGCRTGKQSAERGTAIRTGAMAHQGVATAWQEDRRATVRAQCPPTRLAPFSRTMPTMANNSG